MSRKTVQFKSAPKTADAWVESRDGAESVTAPAKVMALVQASEPIKRFTIDVTESLHKRIKAQCAMRGEKMADVIRVMLEKEFPAT